MEAPPRGSARQTLRGNMSGPRPRPCPVQPPHLQTGPLGVCSEESALELHRTAPEIRRLRLRPLRARLVRGVSARGHGAGPAV